MHFFIAGGSGQTGSQVITDLLQGDHTVTALVRNSSFIKAQPGLTLVKGTPSNMADIKSALETPRLPDAVIITLAHVKGAVFDDQGTMFLTHVARNIAQTLKESTTKAANKTKIVYMSAMGVGESFSSLNFLMKGVVKVSPLGKQFNDHQGAENTLLRLSKEFSSDGKKKVAVTIVRPAMLTNTEEAKVKSLGANGEKAVNFMPKVSRASVARFIVNAALESEWDDKIAVIANTTA